ncbi:helix-turn-helix domain-containing protein [Candidatus Enterococcus murrayae]|uniref:Helix-turn-helix domain-containing protein n=1 Tax=Candidatus Enterococcus murrayae TaxID=2815321 RepID=A0ABS3HEC7_9ENTE|nr:helix-turn-helix domain-containing protein [Enterococcus sp. MJM16]MBO0451812.1 helix-turn-helix domain-containing protein [Enterococcus sp. MJM16]
MDKVVKIDIYDQPLEKRPDKNFYLYYVLKGQITMTLSQGATVMNVRDILVVNPNEQVAIDCADSVYVQISISSNELLRMLDYKKVVIMCNSQKETGRLFDKFRVLLDELIRVSLERDYYYLHYQKEMYQFLSFLITNFSNNLFIEDEEEARKHSILAYIHANYAEDLSLQMIAERFNVTPQYFSKYFKETFQRTFLKFLTEIRLEQALIEVVNTTDTMLKIALDHGFPNQNSFSKAFKEVYEVNPTDYRRTHFEEMDVLESIRSSEVKQLLARKVAEPNNDRHEVTVVMDQGRELLTPYWFNLLNLGSISKIFDNGLNKQIQELKKEMPFKTARVFLDNQLTVNPTFFIEEKALDFLISHDFRLMLVIDYRDIAENSRFDEYFEKFLTHFINRYGIKSIRNTTFELLYNTYFTSEKAKKYAALFNKLAAILDKLKLSGNLLGPGLQMDNEGENLLQFLKENQQLRRLTLTIAPYSIEKYGNKLYINRKSDTSYILQQYELAKRIGRTQGIENIMITSWKDGLNEYSTLNDSSYRGASILKNMIDVYGRIESLPIDQPFDLMLPVTSNAPLTGMPGLITKGGVKKASYYSLKFLNKLDRYFLYKDETILVSRSDDHYLQMVCHNCKRPNYKFYSQEDEGVLTDQIDELFEDSDPKRVKVTINGIKNGQYILKSREISEGQGSCLSVFHEMGFENLSFFGRDELDYLLSASKPIIRGQQLTADNHCLEIEIEMQPNEIRHLHLVYVH